ncbi:hypothetical protein F5887DRAFT_1162733 [Amanita rubescens]|nr:hypothetical protein F5887DRAFT_1162733 [Amanita rubescens]
MVNPFSGSASVRENPCHHRCAEAIERLLQTISGGSSISSEPFQDLVVAFEQALSLARTSRCDATSTGRCHFCLLTLKTIRYDLFRRRGRNLFNSSLDCSVAERIQIKYDNLMNERGFLWSINQFGEFMENLTSDCHMLKELLQSIVIIQERGSTTPFSTTANLFERANGTWIEGGTITNVARSSNSVIVIGPHELGVGVLILLLAACLFLCLL